MHLCYGPDKTQLPLHTTRFYCKEELYDMLLNVDSKPLFLELTSNVFQPLTSRQHVQFACEIMERYHGSFISDVDWVQHTLMQEEEKHTATFTQPQNILENSELDACLLPDTSDPDDAFTAKCSFSHRHGQAAIAARQKAATKTLNRKSGGGSCKRDIRQTLREELAELRDSGV